MRSHLFNGPDVENRRALLRHIPDVRDVCRSCLLGLLPLVARYVKSKGRRNRRFNFDQSVSKFNGVQLDPNSESIGGMASDPMLSEQKFFITRKLNWLLPVNGRVCAFEKYLRLKAFRSSTGRGVDREKFCPRFGEAVANVSSNAFLTSLRHSEWFPVQLPHNPYDA